jgi:hypothetical protein
VVSELRLTAHYYQQFDADLALDVPAEAYGGWRVDEIALSWEHTALVMMHAWDVGTPAQVPGWYRAVEYLPRANAIARDVFPPLLGAARSTGFRVLHVVGGGDYFRSCPGYQRALELGCRPGPVPDPIEADPVLEALRRFRSDRVFLGEHNTGEVTRGVQHLDFPPQARPTDDEGVAEDTHQLLALCREAGVNHLIYAGFAVNWCLLMSPGGMLEMSRHGVMCSVLRQAVTAVENRESARDEAHKEEALWRVALAFGFVFDVDDFITALGAAAGSYIRGGADDV